MRQKHLDEIIDLRKLLLIYKLIHSNDSLPEVDIGLDGRDRELCKPILQLFYGFGSSKETQQEIEKSLEHFIKIKNNIKEHSVEALVYPVIVNAVSVYGNKMTTGQMWESITGSLEGQSDEKNPNVFHSADYGTIHRNTAIKMVCNKFGAKMKHRKMGNELTFNPDYLIKMGNIYGETKGIQTKLVSEMGDVGDGGDAPIGTEPVLNLSDDDKIDKNNTNLIKNLHEIPDLKTQIEDKIGQNRLSLPQDESPESPESPKSANSKSGSRFKFDCYECIKQKRKGFRTDDEIEYQRHWLKHRIKATCYPGKADLEEHGWKAQVRDWEK